MDTYYVDTRYLYDPFIHLIIPVVPLEEQRFAVYALDCPYCILMLTLDIISHDFLVIEGLLTSEC